MKPLKNIIFHYNENKTYRKKEAIQDVPEKIYFYFLQLFKSNYNLLKIPCFEEKSSSNQILRLRLTDSNRFDT